MYLFWFWSIILCQCDWCISLRHSNSWLITFNIDHVAVAVAIFYFHSSCSLASNNNISVDFAWFNFFCFFCAQVRVIRTSQIDWHQFPAVVYLFTLKYRKTHTHEIRCNFCDRSWIYVIVSVVCLIYILCSVCFDAANTAIICNFYKDLVSAMFMTTKLRSVCNANTNNSAWE